MSIEKSIPFGLTYLGKTLNLAVKNPMILSDKTGYRVSVGKIKTKNICTISRHTSENNGRIVARKQVFDADNNTLLSTTRLINHRILLDTNTLGDVFMKHVQNGNPVVTVEKCSTFGQLRKFVKDNAKILGLEK